MIIKDNFGTYSHKIFFYKITLIEYGKGIISPFLSKRKMEHGVRQFLPKVYF